jgi:hypothetical protein
MRSPVIDITVHTHAQTDKAILVSDDGDKRHAVWLPLSQITIHDTQVHAVCDIVLPEWLAKDKGLI